MKALGSLALLSLLRLAWADFSGPSWAPSSDLTSPDSFVAAAFTNLTQTVQEYIAVDSSPDSAAAALSPLAGISNLTFSLGLFSLHDKEASQKLQLHYTSPEIATAPYGTHAVGADSIYRVASVTKVFTVLAGLLSLNQTQWDTSLADIFPELGAYAASHPSSDDPINRIAWQDVTPRNLAAQIAGVPRSGFPDPLELQLAALTGEDVDTSAMGFPPYDPSDPLENPPCLALLLEEPEALCPASPFLESGANRPPAFAPWHTPAYTNLGFGLLGLALGNLTGQPYADLVDEKVFQRLDMANSGVDTPPKSKWVHSVISGADPSVGFDFPQSYWASSGGGLSTLNDMAKLGTAILDGSLLAPLPLGRWLKPVSHTARLQYSIGAPWEIYRLALPTSGGKIVDVYAKLGDSGSYSAYFVLIPEYDVGFTVLSTSTTIATPGVSRFKVLLALADLVTNTLVPAIEKQAVSDAAAAFAGVYVDAAHKAELALVVNQTSPLDAPGLVIANWTSNGTDVLASPFQSYAGPLPWRLVPSIADTAHGRQGFRLVTASDAPAEEPAVVFPGHLALAGDWLTVDSTTFGGIGTSLFVFDTDEKGQAVAVTPAAFRMTLQKA